MIIGACDPKKVVAQFQSEFASTQKLFVLPTGVVGVGDHTRKPVRNFVQVVAILFKVLVSGPPANDPGVVDCVVPVEATMWSAGTVIRTS